MNGRPPFILVPWQRDFLKYLLDLLISDTADDVGRATVIFPHARPMRYLSLLLREEPRLRRPLLMPRMHTVSGLFSELSGRLAAQPAWNAGQLDRVGLLLACVRAEAEQGHLPFHPDAKLFFPWGLRLAALFEECFNQMKEPGNFLHAEDQVTPFAAMLLSRLGHLFARYTEALTAKGWTSPGFDAFTVAKRLAARLDLPPGLLPGEADDGPVYIAGFHLLTGAEELLFRRLWEEGNGRVIIHADPALAHDPSGRSAHWSCAAFADWARRWGTGLEASSLEPAPNKESDPRIRYVAGYDLHSQLTVLQEELADLNAPPDADAPSEPAPLPDDSDARDGGSSLDIRADTVVLLPSGELLLPVLHHLPRTDINISMGYPLSRSPLFRLLDTLASLQEQRKGSDYYWRGLVDLIRHPYIKMLRPAPEENDVTAAPGARNAAPLRSELHRLEQALRDNGRTYTDPRQLMEQCLQLLPPEEMPQKPVLALLDRLLNACFTAFEQPRTTGELALALEDLCELLLECGPHLWKRFPIDAECLFRLRRSLIPELARTELAREPFTPETLFSILRNLLDAERVPFEAEPLVGLQVMGMLESRLLSFRRVIIVDAAEATLPGSPAGDPLLPEALRREVGLPPLHSREQASAHTFFRLLAGAEEAVLLWQEGGEGQGVHEQKSGKSRFVEELLWREEKKRGRLFSATGRDDPLTVLSAAVGPMGVERPGITVTAAVRALLDDLAQKPLSASLLDSYLRCPVQFYYERLVRLVPAKEVQEGDAPLAVGDLLHKTLQEVYTPWLNRPLPGGGELDRLMGEELIGGFLAAPEFARLSRSLPADSLAMLAEAGKKRLTDYLRNQPPTTPVALETSLNAAFAFGSDSVRLTGKADRIDVRMTAGPDDGDRIPGMVILDYKTGRVPAVAAKIWEDEALWRALDAWAPGAGPEQNALLELLARRLQSVQLPLYLLLFSLCTEQKALPDTLKACAGMPASNAFWVALGSQGEETGLLSRRFSPEQTRQVIGERIPALIRFLLRHLFESPVFFPRPGQHCDWCSFVKSCTRSGGRNSARS